VTAADKLHNARCTADDLKLEGAWPVSNACIHQHLWYYTSVADVLKRRLTNPPSRSAFLLDRMVDELCELTDQTRSRPMAKAPRCSACERSAR